MKKKLTFASLTIGLVSTVLLINTPLVAAESFQTKDTPIENTEYKVVKNAEAPSAKKGTISITDIDRQVKIDDKIDEAFILKGVTAKNAKGDNVTDQVTYSLAVLDKKELKSVKKIDSSKPAVYTVTYSLMDENEVSATESSTITVTDEKTETLRDNPEITIQNLDKIAEIGEKVDEKFILDGVKATDLIDGDLSSKISYTLSLVETNALKPIKKIDTSKAGNYLVTYVVKNAAGITATLSGAIKVVEKTNPVESNKLEIAMNYVVKTVTVGEPIDEALILKGVTAADTLDGDLTPKITHTATFSENTPKAKTVPVLELDTSKVGTYNVTYSVENSSGKTASIEGQIEVLEKAADVKNSIELKIQDIGKIVTVGDQIDKNFIMNGVSATDAVDGDITSRITYKLFFAEDGMTTKVEKNDFDTAKAGVYTIIYSVQNSAGETASMEVQLQVLDKLVLPTHKPVIIIKEAQRTVKVGDLIDEAYIMNGVTATDEKDKDVTSKIMYTASFSETTVAAQATNGNLDTSEPGVYTITYVVENSVGGIAEADATITVVKDTTSSTTATEKPVAKTNPKPTSKLPSTGERSSGVVVTILGVLVLLVVLVIIFFKRKNKSQ